MEQKKDIQNIVSVNDRQCENVANILSSYTIKKEFYKRRFINVKADYEQKVRAYFYVVAICHQTYALKDASKNLYGWDYLESVFADLLENDSEFFQPGYLLSKSNEEIENFIRPLFSYDGNPTHCTLDSLEERVSFLKEIDSELDEHFKGSISNLVNLTDGYLYNSGKGYYEILSEFESFSDPFKKKISFLVKLLVDADLINIKDSENYIPIMDYHMQRVLMRLGCIEIHDPRLHEDLVKRRELKSDNIIRHACIEAIKIVADKSGHSIASMNDFFWPHGRSCCNDVPMCLSGKCEKEPCSLSYAINIGAYHKVCIFDDICNGRRDENYRKLWQPVVKTHFY